VTDDKKGFGTLVVYVILGLVGLLFSLYLSYLILVKIGATDLMWFLYWLTVPLSFLTGILSGIVKWMEK